MSKNPLYNALGAIGYIVLIVFVLSGIVDNEAIETSLLMPIMMLSLFTLSVAVMGYIFFYQPIMLYLEGKKEEAVNLFVKTVAIFALVPFSIYLLYYLRIIA